MGFVRGDRSVEASERTENWGLENAAIDLAIFSDCARPEYVCNCDTHDRVHFD
jgi:hypothetical protein